MHPSSAHPTVTNTRGPVVSMTTRVIHTEQGCGLTDEKLADDEVSSDGVGTDVLPLTLRIR